MLVAKNWKEGEWVLVQNREKSEGMVSLEMGWCWLQEIRRKVSGC